MALSKEELQLKETLKTAGKSGLEIINAIAIKRAGLSEEKAFTPTKPTVETPSFIDRAGSVAGSFGRAFESGAEEITANFQEAGKKFEEAPETAIGTFIEKPAILLNTIFRATGTAVKTAFAPITEGVGLGIEKTAEAIGDIPEVQKFAQNKYVSDALDTVLGGLQGVGESYETFKQEKPELAKDIEAGVEILFAVMGEEATNKILQQTASLTRKTLKVGREVLESTTKNIAKTTDEVLTATKGVVERGGALKSRVTTNIAEKQALEFSIKKLPTETARRAVRNGIDINDVTTLTAKTLDDPLYKELVDTAKSFSKSGGKGTDPIAIVGKPIVKRFKYLEKERGRIGQELGKVADNLGSVTKEELTPAVLGELQKVNGLSGIKLGKKGILDFSDTVLASSLSVSDRKAIQQIFNEAIKAGTGKQKHLLRQELFEILGGKKSSLTTMTDTQDKAFQAVRKALSDILETKNDQYKILSNEYRKVVSPLQKARKLLKTIEGEAGDNIDLLDLEAGILARRLTSTAISRPRVEALLRELDAVGAEVGGSTISTKNLQDFYNILNKYYELSPKTGFQGQIKDTVMGGGGIIDRIMNALTGMVGETSAVRQKALEDLLSELLTQ